MFPIRRKGRGERQRGNSLSRQGQIWSPSFIITDIGITKNFLCIKITDIRNEVYLRNYNYNPKRIEEMLEWSNDSNMVLIEFDVKIWVNIWLWSFYILWKTRL